MRFLHSSQFRKSVRRRPRWIQELVLERLDLFMHDHTNPLLGDHPLSGSLQGTRSFSVSGDLRVHYEYVSEETINLIGFGTHAELYGK